MITRLTGKVVAVEDNAVIVDVAGICYEVLVPLSVLQRVGEYKGPDGVVTFVTYHYFQMTPSSGLEVIIGFWNSIERDFFLEFIKVSGIGPRAAVKALNRSIGEIAQAIDRGDIAYLKSLPGIGMQRAKEIVAKLQAKMGKFMLLRDKVAPTPQQVVDTGLKEEALAILLQLQYKKPEAELMMEKALERNANITTSEELLNEIYKQRIKP